MKILAAFFMSDIMPTIPVCCTDPRVQPFISFFGGTVVTPDDTARWIGRMIEYIDGREDDIVGSGNATTFLLRKQYVAYFFPNLFDNSSFIWTRHRIDFVVQT